jgi:hypothetical protein
MNLVYADKTADWVTGAIDVYSPSGPVANDGTAVTGFTLGTNSAAKTAQWPLMGLGSKIMDSAWLGLLWPIVHLLNLLALAIMWWMSALQNILFYVEIAISPIFLGMMLIFALVPVRTNKPRMAGQSVSLSYPKDKATSLFPQSMDQKATENGTM